MSFIIIQKFGGTSLASPDLRGLAADHIIAAVKKGFSPVVVVSAMGRAGNYYATETLIDLALKENDNPDDLTLAFLLACGENISAALLAMLLSKRGYAAVPLTGAMAGIITSYGHLDACIKKVEKKRLYKIIKDKTIPVVAGFQGSNRLGEITTLGRGGSDTTAVALGAALKAQKVEIYTDVSGLMTADPHIVPEAKNISSISYNEILQMASEGAKVIHPRAVETAMEFNVPLVIKNIVKTNKETVIVNNNHHHVFTEPVRKRIVTGITSISRLAQINVSAPLEISQEMFKLLAAANISIDLINLFPEKSFFTIAGEKVQEALEVLQQLKLEGNVTQNLAKVTVIGAGMRGVPGIMARIVAALSRADVQILQTADSHINISCLIHESELNKALRSLHEEFFLEAKRPRRKKKGRQGKKFEPEV
ncbi:MAG TPA: aspartate kinase [Firmicutes bacterium]|nr:aspartate kinase [Bacillota bacterium]